jgi:hypothetical protein
MVLAFPQLYAAFSSGETMARRVYKIIYNRFSAPSKIARI